MENNSAINTKLDSLNKEISAYEKTIEDATEALASAENEMNALVQELSEND